MAESDDVNLGKDDDEIDNSADDEDEDEDEDSDTDSDSDDDNSIDPELARQKFTELREQYEKRVNLLRPKVVIIKIPNWKFYSYQKFSNSSALVPKQFDYLVGATCVK